jgi:hypothetical protein
MSKAQYFIEVDTYWQNSKSYFVGPFETREQAEAWYQQDEPQGANVWLSTSLCGGDIRDAWRIFPAPLSKTEARKHGLRSWSMHDETDNVIDPSVELSAIALSDAVRELREVYS